MFIKMLLAQLTFIPMIKYELFYFQSKNQRLDIFYLITLYNDVILVFTRQ